MNRQVVEALHKDYRDNFQDDPDAFVTVGPTAPTAELQEIYKMMPQEMRDDVDDVWGTRKPMYVRKDMITLVFGQRKFSVSQLKKQEITDEEGYELIKLQFQNTLVKMLNNSKVKNIEDWWKEIVAAVKDSIVIKTGIVTMGNIGSNLILLKTLGVPIKDIVKNHGIATTSTFEFQRDTGLLFNAERDLKNGRGNPQETKFKIAQLKNKIANNPVKELMDAGVYQSIVEDIGSLDKTFKKAGKIDKIVDKISDTNKFGEVAVKAGKQVFLAHETTAYKALRNAAQLSDFVARYTLHQYNLSKGMSSEASINMITDIFINYDLPTHKALQYLNDIGFVMFTKFFIRTQKVILHIMKEHPRAVLTTYLLQNPLLFGEHSDIVDSNMLNYDYLGRMNFALPSIVPQLVDIPTINLVTGK